MKCANCLKDIPDTAKACPFCEAAVEPEPTPEEIEVAKELLNQMPKEALSELQALVQQSETADDLINAIFVGDCPKCDSSETGDCDRDPEIENPLVGRCYDCGTHYCTECRRLLDPKKLDCPCWEEEIQF